MNLKNISDTQLDENLKQLVLRERDLLANILSHIAEVDRRRLYLKMAYASLFEYLTKHIGYPNGSAQRRIDAARLFNEIPEVIPCVESGAVNLAQITLMQKGIRQAQAQNKMKVSSVTKQNLFAQIKEKTLAESELLINQDLNIKIKENTTFHIQQNESIRMEITLNKEQWQKMCRMRELLSNSLPHGSGWDQVLEFLCDKVISQKEKCAGLDLKASFAKQASQISDKKIDFTKTSIVLKEENSYKSCEKDHANHHAKYNSQGKKENQSTNKHQTQKINNPKNKSKKQTPAGVRAAIPIAVQREIFSRDQCCQYQDEKTGRVCQSRWKLNIDHIKPLWANGDSHNSNLRVLCAAHNRFIYRQQSSLEMF